MSDWYVDNAAKGANNGGKDEGWTDAWKTLRGVVWGTNGVKAGDTLWISGGTGSKTYFITGHFEGGEPPVGELLVVSASGTSGSRIYIKPGAAHPTLSAGHDGTAIFDLQNTNGYARAFYLFYNNYITVDGSDGTYNIVPIGDRAHRKFHFTNGYVDFGEVLTADMELFMILYSNNFKLLNCEFSKASTGAYLGWLEENTTPPSQSEVAGNYVHDIRSRRGMSLTGSAVTNKRYDAVLFHDNEIQINTLLNNGTAGDGVQISSGVSIYNNLFYGIYRGAAFVSPRGQHSDFIEAGGIYNKVYNNIFRDPGSTCVRPEFGDDPGGYWQIFNNILEITNTDNSAGALQPIQFQAHETSNQHINDVVVANNAFIGFDQFYGFNFDMNSGVITSNIIIQNNICYHSGKVGSYECIRCGGGTCDQRIIDNNLLYAGDGHGSTLITCGATSPYTQSTGYIGQPALVSYSFHTKGNNYHLSTSDTQAKNKGENLQSYFDSVGISSNDYDGTARPQGSAWDIGAFEIVEGGGISIS